MELQHTRGHSLANEIADTDSNGDDIETTTGTDWDDPVYDAAGNTVSIPWPTDLTLPHTCIYDAWNRLAEVQTDDGTPKTVAVYEYDGLNRRVKAHIDSDAPDGPDDSIDLYRHFYYNSDWQLLETRDATSQQGENTAPDTLYPDRQYVWSQRYIDAPVLRDENGDSDDICNGDPDTGDEGDSRVYYCNDANMNVTALLGYG